MGNNNPVSSIHEDIFAPLEHYGPVTALKIHENYIIAGYGSILKVFLILEHTHSLLFSQQVFKRNKIHSIGVSIDGTKLSVAGGRSFMVADFKSLLQNQDPDLIEKAVNEWIVSVEFADSAHLLVLTSHNVVYKVNVVDAVKFHMVESIHCNEKSILYSGSIRVLDDGRILVAAGTVMHGVIVWDLNCRKIVHNLTDHEGSIFGVKIDPTGKHLISCSDDRSIKLYDLGSGKLLANGWGHGSRIWNLAFFKDSSTTVKVFSTGEDCTARVWDFRPESDLLHQSMIWDNCHLGKHVWSGDVDDTNLKVCVTGGADGRIRLHDLGSLIRVTYPVENVAKQAGFSFHKNEIIKQYLELGEIFVALTSNGRILSLHQPSEKWTLVDVTEEDIERISKFGILKGFENLNIALVLDRNGNILVLQFANEMLASKTWIEDEVFGINKAVNILTSVHVSENKYFILTDSPNPKVPLVLREFAVEQGNFVIKKTKKLNKPDQGNFTFTSLVVDLEHNWLILGSRHVTLALYDLSVELNALEVSSVFRKVSLGDTITAMFVIEQRPSSVLLLVAVRDGYYMYIDFSKNASGEFVYRIDHQNKLTKGFVEGAHIHNNDLILYGFKSSHFYIWNESKQLEIMSEFCGGSHRQWNLFIYGNGRKLDYKFVYLSKALVYITSHKARFAIDSYGVLRHGTHGREIRDISISPQVNSDQSRLLLTASEDATLRLGKLLANGSIENYWTFTRHISGLQRVKFFDSEYAASSSANEEFYIWKISQLQNSVPIMAKYAKLQSKNDNPDLRIMDFDFIPVHNGFVIATVYSDSKIKLLHFNITTKEFTVIANDYYSTFCILNAKFLALAGRTLLMISATDGHLTVWEIDHFLKAVPDQDKVPKLGNMNIKQQLHQNALKTFLVLPREDLLDIITGGDDNALILSSLKYEDGILTLKCNRFVGGAASSTITSISRVDEYQVAVTSVDQIVRLWSFAGNSLHCTAARYTTIADTGCSDSTVLGGRSVVVVGGAGISSWAICQ